MFLVVVFDMFLSVVKVWYLHLSSGSNVYYPVTQETLSVYVVL